MINNDILRRLRYALDLNDTKMTEVFALDGHTVKGVEIPALLISEGEEGFDEFSDDILKHFLDGLIILKRGKQEPKPGASAPRPEGPLSNNLILKKIRIALELKEEDMLTILKLADFEISKGELSALFRRKGHRHYKPCGDQMLRRFLKGLTLHLRG